MVQYKDRPGSRRTGAFKVGASVQVSESATASVTSTPSSTETATAIEDGAPSVTGSLSSIEASAATEQPSALSTASTTATEQNVAVSESAASLSTSAPSAIEQNIAVSESASALSTSTPTVTSSDWFDTNWDFRKGITIDSNQVDGNLTDFPVLINIDSDTDLSNGAQSNGDDIVFASDDGTTKLDHEIEDYDGSGTLWAHVKVPSVSSSSDTDIYVYYGNSGAANQENVSGVWSNGFEGVWHLDEEASGTGNADVYQDSTSNNNHGDDQVSATGQAGQVSDGQQFDGSDDYIDIPDDASLSPTTSDEISIGAWIKTNTSQSEAAAGIVTKDDLDTGREWNLHLSSATSPNSWAGRFRIVSLDSPDTVDGTTDLRDNSWHYVVGTYDGSTLSIYLDDSLDNSVSTSGTLSDTTTTVNLGRFSDGSFPFGGNIDEARISSTARSTAWISTTYNNQNNPSTFYTLGEETTAQGETATATESASTQSTSTPSSIELAGVLESGSTSSTSSPVSTESATATETSSALGTGSLSATEQNITVSESASALSTSTPSAIEQDIAVSESGSMIATSTPSTVDTATAIEIVTTASTATPSATEQNVAVSEIISASSTSTPSATEQNIAVTESGALVASATVFSRERFGDVFFGYTNDWDSLTTETNVAHPDDELSLSGGDDGEAITAFKLF